MDLCHFVPPNFDHSSWVWPAKLRCLGSHHQLSARWLLVQAPATWAQNLALLSELLKAPGISCSLTSSHRRTLKRRILNLTPSSTIYAPSQPDPPSTHLAPSALVLHVYSILEVRSGVPLPSPFRPSPPSFILPSPHPMRIGPVLWTP